MLRSTKGIKSLSLSSFEWTRFPDRDTRQKIDYFYKPYSKISYCLDECVSFDSSEMDQIDTKVAHKPETSLKKKKHRHGSLEWKSLADFILKEEEKSFKEMMEKIKKRGRLT